MLTIRQLQVTYGKQTALQIQTPITFERGDRIGVIGSNGAGKTTLVKALLGLAPYQGSIVTELKPEQMAVHMQFNEYVTTMPVKYIMETILNTRIKSDSQLQELIRFFDFEGCLGKRYSALSGGQKQRLTIILVMMQRAELTFYDEVTSGLDFESRQKLMEKLVEWYRDRKDTLVVISHYYEELEQLADKLLILDQGKVVAFGKKEELFRTYCGKAILVLENNERNKALTKGCSLLVAPEHLIALTCRDEAEEEKMLSLLNRNNINFKRSNCDIEIMTINARKSFYEKPGQSGQSRAHAGEDGNE
ncbi:MAG: ABC transporter ATP-binding protein [Lachnospiraceae bacterium]|nr:ABC transporter ATP-binding protein [Lachnospiraceae bacterium]